MLLYMNKDEKYNVSINYFLKLEIQKKNPLMRVCWMEVSTVKNFNLDFMVYMK